MGSLKGYRVSILLALSSLTMASACGNSDYAVFRADSLLVSPCHDDADGLFEPFELESDFLRWYVQGHTGFLEMRKGFRTPTISDAVYLQITDTAEFDRIMEATPGASIEMDRGLVRISLVMLGTCPDGNQPLVAGKGLVTFTEFENHINGMISGNATFDLLDGRTLGDPVPALVAHDASLVFSMQVRRGPPYQEFTQPGD